MSVCGNKSGHSGCCWKQDSWRRVRWTTDPWTRRCSHTLTVLWRSGHECPTRSAVFGLDIYELLYEAAIERDVHHTLAASCGHAAVIQCGWSLVLIDKLKPRPHSHIALSDSYPGSCGDTYVGTCVCTAILFPCNQRNEICAYTKCPFPFQCKRPWPSPKSFKAVPQVASITGWKLPFLQNKFSMWSVFSSFDYIINYIRFWLNIWVC